MDNAKATAGKSPAPARSPLSRPSPGTAAATPAVKPPLPPLFRRVDWLTFGVTFLVVFIGYWLTLSPELTLEDSGELAVGAYYAGIPHPPGYPVWSIYSWFWTALIPFKNMAWRAALGTAFSGALASGLLAFVVSRGGSMLIESIDDLKNLSRRLENGICLVAGFVAGTLIGFNGYMWSQAVIVEVYPLSLVSLMGVVLCLLRWVYAPHQHRYLYGAFFMYGICFNNHQSLLVIAMGVEVLVWMAEPKLGRELFFWNTVMYLAGVAIRPDILWGNMPVRVIFNTIGIGSMGLWIWLFWKTKKTWIEFGRDLIMLAMLLLYGLWGGNITHYVQDALADPEITKTVPSFLIKAVQNIPLLAVAAIGSTGLFVYLVNRTKKCSKEWAVTLGCGGSWLAGAAFYLYMAIAGMSNPPMQWGYPRTLDGFIHAITRGQYEKIRPTSGTGDTVFEVVGSFFKTYFTQLWRALEGLNLEFSILCLLIALVVFLFFFKMKRRERAWIIGMTALFVCTGPFLVMLLNFSSDRQSLELCRVFLTASHTFVAMSVGYGLALLTAAMAAHYDSLRKVSILGGICALDFALFMLAINSQYEFERGRADTAAAWGFIKILCWLAAITCVIILWRKGLERDRLLAVGIPGLFVATSATLTGIAFLGDPPGPGGLMHVLHEIVNSFSPDQYGLPVFAALILVVAALLFLVRVWTSRNRAPVGVALALFAILPSYSVMTHWFENEQHEHWFGYWFGHDMFTPPFIASNGEFSYDAKLRAEALKGPDARLVYPEMTRDAVLYGGTDPGRFCPTYMIFCDSFLPVRCRPEADKAFDRRDVYIITQNALADATYMEYIRAHYHRSAQKARGLDTPFFQYLFRAPGERGNVWNETNILARLVSPLDSLFTGIGERIEKQRRAGSSFFTPADFLDLDNFARKLAARETQFTRRIYQGLSPETQNLLAGGDRGKLGKALARDLNRVLEADLYDSKPLADEVDRQWRATFELEEADGNLQRALQYQMVTEAMRLQSLIPQIQQTIRQSEAEQTRKTDVVVQYLTTNGVPVSKHLKAFIRQAPQSSTRIRLNRQLFEAAFPNELAVSPGGVYPDKEIYIASPADSQRCFSEYTTDASRRKMHDDQFPNERPQVRPGENVVRVGDKVQVSGQVAVMTINGLLTKVIFDHNPDNEFFVEESFPLEWMYPHLTPFGIIMKVNREPVPELSEAVVERDHKFWSKYSERLIGDWITYETPVKEIVEFAERVYLRRDFKGFKGDLKFLRDDQAQKSFSKLRSSIATSVYVWRSGMSGITPPQYMPATDAVRTRMIKEADFALRQAFAFCPYSPEAAIHYVQLLANTGRMEDALLIAETSLKLDPYNPNFINLVKQLRRPDAPVDIVAQIKEQIAQVESELRTNPADIHKTLDLAVKYYQIGRLDRTIAILDGILESPHVDVNSAYAVASAYAQLNNVPKTKAALEKLAKLAPNQPDIWYNLAAAEATLNKPTEALQHLRHAFDLGARLRTQNSNAPDFRATVADDPRFANLRENPEFKALLQPK